MLYDCAYNSTYSSNEKNRPELERAITNFFSGNLSEYLDGRSVAIPRIRKKKCTWKGRGKISDIQRIEKFELISHKDLMAWRSEGATYIYTKQNKLEQSSTLIQKHHNFYQKSVIIRTLDWSFQLNLIVFEIRKKLLWETYLLKLISSEDSDCNPFPISSKLMAMLWTTFLQVSSLSSSTAEFFSWTTTEYHSGKYLWGQSSTE